MKSIEIKDTNVLLACVLKGKAFPEGLCFHTKDTDFVQVGTWRYKKGKKTIPHRHMRAKRIAMRTQEVLFVKTGRVRAEIYTDREKLVEKVLLRAGDILMVFAGGHSYEILEDGTEVLEVKNGPYIGIEKDKKTFNEK